MSEDNTQPKKSSENTQIEVKPLEIEATEKDGVSAKEAKKIPQKDDKSEAKVGDTIKVYTKVKEGEKERIQIFEGIIISKKGDGLSKTMTVRKIGVGGIGVERIWPIHSPNITKIEIKQKGKVRKAKLYYMRKRIGKASMAIKKRI